MGAPFGTGSRPADEAASSTASSPEASIPSAISALFDAADLCQRSDGPDRRLDKAIAKSLGLPHGRDSGWCNSENGDYWVVEECAKPFTNSVDAALTIIPHGWEWSMENCAGETFGPYRVEMGYRIDVEAKTLPLAICAAALRAHVENAIEARGEQESSK